MSAVPPPSRPPLPMTATGAGGTDEITLPVSKQRAPWWGRPGSLVLVVAGALVVAIGISATVFSLRSAAAHDEAAAIVAELREAEFEAQQIGAQFEEGRAVAETLLAEVAEPSQAALSAHPDAVDAAVLEALAVSVAELRDALPEEPSEARLEESFADEGYEAWLGSTFLWGSEGEVREARAAAKTEKERLEQHFGDVRLALGRLSARIAEVDASLHGAAVSVLGAGRGVLDAHPDATEETRATLDRELSYFEQVIADVELPVQRLDTQAVTPLDALGGRFDTYTAARQQVVESHAANSPPPAGGGGGGNNVCSRVGFSGMLIIYPC